MAKHNPPQTGKEILAAYNNQDEDLTTFIDLETMIDDALQAKSTSEIVGVPGLPAYVKQEHLEFLNDLRESGGINMYLAKRELLIEYEISDQIARKILTYWMTNFVD